MLFGKSALILLIMFILAVQAVSAIPANLETESIARTIDTPHIQSNRSVDLNQSEEPVWWKTAITSMKAGSRSSDRFIYGGIISILVMQMIILMLVIRCRKQRTFRLIKKQE